jgi:hypothetical protein
MVASADTQGWAYPYWNIMQLDAALNGLANALRTGAAPLSAPAVAPTLSLKETGGSVPAGQTIEVVQTFVDEWGRETDAGTLASLSTGTGITDPVTAPTLGTPSTAATGYGGGTLVVVFTWLDENGGETLASPADTVQLPYLSGGLYSQVDVVLPSTPAAAGAVMANVYVQHRGGNVVLAQRIYVDTEDTVTLDGTTLDCYLTPPYVNTTSSTKSIEITGATDAAAEKTRFYIRQNGEAWTTGDHRLSVGGVDEWDIDTVSYPLVYIGTNLVAGWPPTVSQVKAIRPIELDTETSGTLAESQIAAAITRDTELATVIGERIISGFAVTPHSPEDMKVDVATGAAILAAGLFTPAGVELTIPTADASNPRIDIICVADDGTIEGPTENAALKGTPAGSPVAPSTPSGYLRVAEISVPATDTTIGAAQITDSRTLLTTLVAETIARLAHEAQSSHLGASVGETNTGTDTTKRLTADGLAGSYAGTKCMSIVAVPQDTNVDAEDGKLTFAIPPALNGMNLIYANAYVNTAGVTNATTIDIYNVTDSVDMLSSAISIASEATAGTAGTVDTAHDDVATGDVLRIDVTTASSTPAIGLMVTLEFRLP